MLYKTTSKSKRYDFTLSQAVVTKAADGTSDECVIEGYANTCDKDRVGDVVLPEAFEKHLPIYLKNPVLLANHDWNDPCGVVLEAKITKQGLWIKAKISDTRPDIKTLIREGCLRTFSIGYNEVLTDYDESTKTKYIKELELLEISIVTVPANTEAMFTQALAKTEDIQVERIEGESVEAWTARQVESLIGEGYERERAAAMAIQMCDSGKNSLTPKTAKIFKDFINAVKDAADRELTGTEVSACCEYFISNEEHMTKKELVELLRSGKKSVEAAAAPTDAAKPADPAKPAEGSDPIKEIMAKLDAIAQALASILENKAKPEEAEPEEDAQDGESDEADAEKAEPEQDDEELSDEECEKELEAIEQELAALEDSENL